MTGHAKYVCQYCDATITQCRCRGPHEIVMSACVKCDREARALKALGEGLLALGEALGLKR